MWDSALGKKSRLIADPLEYATGHLPEHRLGPTASTASYAFVKKPDLVGRKPPVRGSAVFNHMVNGTRLRDRNHRVFRNAPVQCHLGLGLTSHPRHVGKDVYRISQFDVE